MRYALAVFSFLLNSSGFVAKAIERRQQPSATVAPPGDPQ
jgi:hypothetical protein